MKVFKSGIISGFGGSESELLRMLMRPGKAENGQKVRVRKALGRRLEGICKLK